MNLWVGNRVSSLSPSWVTLEPFLHAAWRLTGFHEIHFWKCTPESFIFLSSASIPMSQSAQKFHFLFNNCVLVISFLLLCSSPMPLSPFHGIVKTTLNLKSWPQRFLAGVPWFPCLGFYLQNRGNNKIPTLKSCEYWVHAYKMLDPFLNLLSVDYYLYDGGE